MSAIRKKLFGSFACLWFGFAASLMAQPSVGTDFSDYPPGSTVHITGAGFAANESVRLQVLNITTPEDDGDEHLPWTVTADANGGFETTWFVTLDELDQTLHLTATGQISGLVADMTFTDGNASDGSGTLTVAPSNLVAGTLNTLTFTFTSENGKDYLPGSLTTITVPAGWSIPQTNSSSAPGFVSLVGLGSGSGSISNITGSGPWTVNIVFAAPKNGNGFILTFSNALAPAVFGTNTFSAATRNTASAGSTLTPLGGGGGASGSPIVTLSGSTPVQLAFTTAAQALTVGSNSATMTVQIQDAGGNPTNATAPRTVSLSTTSNGGAFKDSAGNVITSIAIAAGQNSTNFIYADSKAGSPTLTASSSSPSVLASATQIQTVAKAASKIAITSSSATNGYLQAVSFNAVLPSDATGAVVFKTNNISPVVTAAISAGTAGPLTTTNLARGMNVITVEYAGDANFFGSTNSVVQIVTNHPPVAQNITVRRTPGMSLKIPISTVATNWDDADGDVLKMSAIARSTRGINLFTNSAWILYSNPTNTDDQFSYTIADGFGGTTTALVNVVTTPFSTGQDGGSLSVIGGNIVVKFMGIPGLTYQIQCNTNLASPVWNDISTNTPNASGVILYTNSIGGAGNGYYRLKWQP